MSRIHLALLAAGIAVALIAIMAGAWRVQQTTGHSGWIDVFWTLGVGGVAVVASLIPLPESTSPRGRQITVAVMAALWSLRLGLHIATRTRAGGDDPRYRQMIAQWGANAPRNMFRLLQSQAAVGAVLALSIVLAARNPHPGLHLPDLVGVALLLTGIVGESIADHQLRRFRADPANRDAVCDIGLWRRSRHPNYFFEWVCWLAYPLIAIDPSGDSHYGWLALLAPACMYWALVYVSGIPPLEEHMLRSRAEAFRAYQRRTRPFFPVPRSVPRAAASGADDVTPRH